MMVEYQRANVDTRKRVLRPGLSPYAGHGLICSAKPFVRYYLQTLLLE
jgi:hypothetical protein